MALARIKKGDLVFIRAGREKGKTGRVLKVLGERALVEKLNMVKRHSRPSQKNPQGGIIEKEASIHLSNLMAYNEKLAKPTRVGVKTLADGKKVRICKKSGESLDA